MFDWVAHKKHRDAVIDERRQWVGLCDADCVPMMDAPAPVEMDGRMVRNAPDECTATFRVKSPLGVVHPMVSELIGEDLGRIDAQGRFELSNDETRFLVFERAAGRRAYRITHGEADVATDGPEWLTVFGTNEMSVLDDVPAWSVPLEVDGVWQRVDRDFVGELSVPRDLLDVQLARVADGYTLGGAAVSTVGRLIKESLEATWRAVGVVDDPPVIVGSLPEVDDSPMVLIRPQDGSLWSTVAPVVAAAGLTVSARMVWPGDEGFSVLAPTIVVDVARSEVA